ncbi:MULTISPECIES: hypothetical protein [Clostridioides]|uniref:hypothetical protein n=1 Tax=unclassified Clostridioides TaxID=2635829 RepID=UPI00038D53CC|nr:hypothetical protein QEW_0350 [Clostridioides difficile CD160]MCC0647870.1 hypothetical protein [Clostridioides sp. ZZV15-6598]MCC0653635.1 hypothetical protein [Clostridioides sp. ES-S-0001-03]MCE4722103.1 hypothetical protein [Clostridioides difficile]MCE4883721.1 hypothetical protein [Clostridioides difficile]
MWTTVLKRPVRDFLKTTPKKLFSQLDAHGKFKGVDKEKKNVEIVNSTEFM